MQLDATSVILFYRNYFLRHSVTLPNLASGAETKKTRMSESDHASAPRPPRPLARSATGAADQKGREQRIVSVLNRCLSVADIARRRASYMTFYLCYRCDPGQRRPDIPHDGASAVTADRKIRCKRLKRLDSDSQIARPLPRPEIDTAALSTPLSRPAAASGSSAEGRRGDRPRRPAPRSARPACRRERRAERRLPAARRSAARTDRPAHPSHR